jgi:hypothetical protein
LNTAVAPTGTAPRASSSVVGCPALPNTVANAAGSASVATRAPRVRRADGSTADAPRVAVTSVARPLKGPPPPGIRPSETIVTSTAHAFADGSVAGTGSVVAPDSGVPM